MKSLRNIGAALSLLFLTASCGDDFLDVNTDPNNPADAPARLVLPAAIASTAGVVGGDYAILGGIWSQHWTQSNGSNQYKDIDAFNIQGSTMQRNWVELYSGALNDYKFIKRKATEEEDWNIYLMATVMEAYTYQILVDLYDRIPFDEALRGEEGLLNPTFQGGQEVYDALIARIDDALAKPTTASSLAGTQDFVFGGNMVNWRKFANTLKLKIYMRQSEVNPGKAQSGIAGLAGAQFLDTDAAMAVFQDQPSRSNPLFEQDQRQLNTTGNLRASTTLFSFLDVNGDPRTQLLFVPGSGGHKSLNQGEFDRTAGQVAPASVSRARISPSAPVYFISKAESYFLQAEAAERGWGSGSASALYEAGVRASFEQLASLGPTFRVTQPLDDDDVTPADIAALDPTALLSTNYAYPNGSTQENLEAIITQKWISFAGTMQGIEAFFEKNRTDFPETNLTVAPTNTGAYSANDPLNSGYEPGQFTYPATGITNNRAFAKRLLFPLIERTRNPNTPPQVDFTTGVWWDVN